MPVESHGQRTRTLLAQLRSQLKAGSGDSRKLATDPEDNRICVVRFDPSITAVVVVWKRYATSEQLRFVHELILDLLEKHTASKILGNDTALATIHPEDQAWIIEDWMPRAVAAGLKAAASKRPESYFGHLSVSSVQAHAPHGVQLRSFADEASARQWLIDMH